MRRAALIAVLLLPSAGLAQTVEPPLTLAAVERLALDGSPTLASAQASVEAARSRGRQAGAWPNPILGYSAEELTTRDEGPRGAHGVFIEQAIPLGGKLRLGREVFDRVADEAAARADLQRQRVVSSVRTLFYEVLAAERRIEVLERLAAIGSETTGVTAQLFNVGAADRPDFLESEIETRRIQLDLTAARNDAFARRLQLAALVGLEDIAARRLEGSIDGALPELERETVTRALMEQSPQVRAARAAVARAQSVTARARVETSPDLFLRGGAGYNREHGEDTGRPIGWEARIEAGVSLPIFNRNQGGIAAARADETRAQAELRRLELSLRSRVAGEFAVYLTALRAAESYRADILPRAQQAYTLYLARYREMGAAYPQVLMSQRTLFQMSREYVGHVDTAWRSALRLQGLLAGDGLQSPETTMDDAGSESAGSREPGRPLW